MTDPNTLAGAALGVLLTTLGAAFAFGAWQARNWPTTTGTVTTARLRRHQDEAVHYQGTVEYEYDVQGVTHHGRTLTFGLGRAFQDAGHALTARYPAGSPVTVFVHPRRPDRSTLNPGMHLWASGLFLLAGVLLLALTR